MVNLNKLARTITLAEGKKVNLSIGQVKEVLRITLSELAKLPAEEVLKTVARYK